MERVGFGNYEDFVVIEINADWVCPRPVPFIVHARARFEGSVQRMGENTTMEMHGRIAVFRRESSDIAERVEWVETREYRCRPMSNLEYADK